MAHSPEERSRLIDELGRLPEALQKEVSGLQDEQLDYKPEKNEWSIRQIVHHLADSHMNAFIRTKLLLTEQNPTIKPYLQEAWAELADSNQLWLSPSLDILQGLHARWVQLFESLSPDDWNRTGQHPESGEMTVASILEGYANHGQNHIDQIRRNKQALGLEAQGQ